MKICSKCGSEEIISKKKEIINYSYEEIPNNFGDAVGNAKHYLTGGGLALILGGFVAGVATIVGSKKGSNVFSNAAKIGRDTHKSRPYNKKTKMVSKTTYKHIEVCSICGEEWFKSKQIGYRKRIKTCFGIEITSMNSNDRNTLYPELANMVDELSDIKHVPYKFIVILLFVLTVLSGILSLILGTNGQIVAWIIAAILILISMSEKVELIVNLLMFLVVMIISTTISVNIFAKISDNPSIIDDMKIFGYIIGFIFGWCIWASVLESLSGIEEAIKILILDHFYNKKYNKMTTFLYTTLITLIGILSGIILSNGINLLQINILNIWISLCIILVGMIIFSNVKYVQLVIKLIKYRQKKFKNLIRF